LSMLITVSDRHRTLNVHHRRSCAVAESAFTGRVPPSSGRAGE
jgi:hypothetical protein